jgi:hypothetical protein
MTSTARLRPPTRVAVGPAFPSPKSTAKAHQETGDGTALCERPTQRTHPSQCQPGWANDVRDGQLWLAYQTQQPSILLAPLTAAEKIQLSSRTGSRQRLRHRRSGRQAMRIGRKSRQLPWPITNQLHDARTLPERHTATTRPLAPCSLAGSVDERRPPEPPRNRICLQRYGVSVSSSSPSAVRPLSMVRRRSGVAPGALLH